MTSQILPAGACDCHMHVFDAEYPPIPNASLSPSDASLIDYARIQGDLGNRRFVIVQPSIYGLDNSLLLATLRDAGPDRALGVAVVNHTVTDDVLGVLYASGVRGVRFNQVQNGVTSLDMLQALDSRLNDKKLHVQLHARPDQLIEAQPLLRSLQSPLVIDHVARLASMNETRSELETMLYRWLDSGKVWLKLSGPYLASEFGAPYKDIADFISRITRRFPQRLVWGSDWPHATETTPQNDVEMLAYFKNLMPNSSVEYAIFVDNPTTLYGFQKQDSVRVDL